MYEQMSDDALETELAELNAERDALTEKAHEISAVLRERQDRKSAVNVLAGLSDQQKSMLQAIISAGGIESEEVVKGIQSEE